MNQLPQILVSNLHNGWLWNNTPHIGTTIFYFSEQLLLNVFSSIPRRNIFECRTNNRLINTVTSKAIILLCNFQDQL